MLTQSRSVSKQAAAAGRPHHLALAALATAARTEIGNIGERAGGKGLERQGPTRSPNSCSRSEAECGRAPTAAQRAPDCKVAAASATAARHQGRLGSVLGGRAFSVKAPHAPQNRRMDEAAVGTIVRQLPQSRLQLRLGSPHRRHPMFLLRLASAGVFPSPPAGHRTRVAPLAGASPSSCTPA